MVVHSSNGPQSDEVSGGVRELERSLSILPPSDQRNKITRWNSSVKGSLTSIRGGQSAPNEGERQVTADRGEDPPGPRVFAGVLLRVADCPFQRAGMSFVESQR